MQNIFDRDNQANKFICDREARALGLKGPVDFIEGEDGCDKRIEEYMKNKAHITESSGDKKAFDVCIMNPPYSRNLHLKILEKVIPVAEETINISPIRWLQDPLAKYKKNSDYNKFKESIAEHIKRLKSVNARESQSVFNAIFSMDLGIYHFDNGKYEIKREYPEFMIRIAEQMKENSPQIDHLKKDGYRVRISMIGGGKSGGSGQRKHSDRNPISKDIVYKDGRYNGKPWYEYYVRNQYSKTTDEITDSIRFDTEEEAYNFIRSYDTTFAKVVFHYSVTGVNISSLNILWMGDYTHQWDNKRFCDYFNITGYISDTEAETDSEWEEILKTMEKYK